MVLSVAPLTLAFAQDDLLGKKRGGGNSGGSNSGGSDRGGSKGSDSKGSGSSGGRQSGGSGSSGGSVGSGRGGSQDNGGSNRERNTGGSQQRDPIIVRDRDNSQARTGRSGQAQYKSQNNGRANGGRDVQIVQDVPDYNNSIRRQAGREENVRVQRNQYQYRSGYYSYNNNWRDNNFSYPYYSFNYGNNCALSPWYSYTNMPGYITIGRISFNNVFELSFNCNNNYRWSYKSRYDRYSSTYELDRAVASIDSAFDRADSSRLEDLIPSRGRVTIRSRWERPYTVDTNDYFDMMADLIESTRTRRYNITSVNYGERDYGTVRVTAEHVFTDGYGNQRTNYHCYTLEKSGRHYEIVEFQSSDRRF
ncbi:MAG: hypothetical protein K8R88_14925 [Armatimonadetes bacterium]|nr:hypothetical protein [Armatimonadota bacterium]